MTEKTVLAQKAYILFYMRDPAGRSSSGVEQAETNSSPALRSWLSDGASDVESDMEGGGDEFRGSDCQRSKGNGACCNSSFQYSKGSCQDASFEVFSKVDRVTPVWRL